MGEKNPFDFESESPKATKVADRGAGRRREASRPSFVGRCLNWLKSLPKTQFAVLIGSATLAAVVSLGSLAFAWNWWHTRQMDREYWAVEKLRLERCVLVEAGRVVNSESVLFDSETARRLLTEIAIVDADMVAKESDFVLRHRVELKKYRDDFNRRHPQTEVLYKDAKPIGHEAVARVVIERGNRKKSDKADAAAVSATALSILRERAAYKSFADELK